MKLNFLNVLKGKSTPDEIAEQIVALEEKQKICEKEKQEAKERAKEIRSRIMCGEKVNPNAVKEADSALEECNINLDVVSESLEKLKEKLEEAFIALKDETAQKVIEIRKRLNRDRDKVKLDLWKAKGKLFGLAFALHGHPAVTKRDLESYPAFSPSVGTEEYDIFHAEKDRVIAGLTRPTVADVEQDISDRSHWIKDFDVDDEVKDIMRKYRSQPVEEKEKVIE